LPDPRKRRPRIAKKHCTNRAVRLATTVNPAQLGLLARRPFVEVPLSRDALEGMERQPDPIPARSRTKASPEEMLRRVARTHAEKPDAFVAAVREAERTLRCVVDEPNVIEPILKILTGSSVQMFCAHGRMAPRIVRETIQAQKRLEKVRAVADRLLRRAMRPEELERELEPTLKPFFDALLGSRRADEWKRHWKEIVYRDRDARLSLTSPSRSSVFGELVLEPLWAILARDGRRRSAEDPLPAATIARLVHAIIGSYFDPSITRGLTANAIRSRVLKAREKKLGNPRG